MHAHGPRKTSTQGDSSTEHEPPQPHPFLEHEKPPFLSLPQMRYQNSYVWLILVSALDLILTMLVLFVWDGHEVNPVAAAVIAHVGFIGAIGLKFGIVILVILTCELVGRRSDRDGRTLARGAILISAVAVIYTFGLLVHAGPPPA
jgi:hypothetical protein